MTDSLDEETMKQLDVVMEKIIPHGRETAIYDECIGQIRKRELKAQEAQIISNKQFEDDTFIHLKAYL